MSRCRASAKVVVLDCCHGGTFKGEDVLGGIDNLSGTGRYILAAASPTHVASDSDVDGSPSPFTRVLVEGLGGEADDANRDGYVDLDDLYEHVRRSQFEGPAPYRRWDGEGFVYVARSNVQPHTSGAPQEPKDDQSPPWASLIDLTTQTTYYSERRVQEFRGRLKEDIERDFPSNLSAREFLTRAELLRGDKLTVAGALLFGENPSAVVDTAIVQCVRYVGTTKAAARERLDLHGTIPEQIAVARQFVEDRVRLIEAPLANSVYTAATYDYPMVAVREIIVNALVHRDYAPQGSCVHVRMFSDRIEVVNPGKWQAPNFSKNETRRIDDLTSESHRRNFRLARVLTWVKMFEGEGSGIPTAVHDCRAIGAPIPTVTQENGLIRTTIFPRAQTTTHLSAASDDLSAERLEARGLYVWSGDDLGPMLVSGDEGSLEGLDSDTVVDVALLRDGKLPHLTLQFPLLIPSFANWLARKQQRKRGARRIRIFWIVGEPSQYRSAALVACLAQAVMSHRAVYDAGHDLYLAIQSLELTPPLTANALIGLDLPEPTEPGDWQRLSRTVLKLRKTPSDVNEAYPLLTIAGTAEQEETANAILGQFIEIHSNTPRGLPHQRVVSHGGARSAASSSLPAEHVFNRGLPITAHTLFGRDVENDFLRRAWSSDRTRVVSVVGYGGTGKSALINTWLSAMRSEDYRGATRVLAWSFYSQGTRENLVSADPFINFSLDWLGDDSSRYQNPWAKGKQLASLIKRHRFLLILDGMEPLQQPLSAPDVGGQLTDDSIRALLESLAEPNWEGLCVVTSRIPLTDLRMYEGNDGKGTVATWNLDNLDDEAGAALLRHIIGAPATFKDLQAAVRRVDGHALSVSLLGNYIRDVHGGDLAGQFDLEKLSVEASQGGHARRIVSSYVRWLSDHKRLAELALLQIIGLFDRPATPEAMKALLDEPRLMSLKAVLHEVGSAAWNDAVDRLREMGLLNQQTPGMPGTLDSHPLIREHFRDLDQRSGQLWEFGNEALFRYYASHAPRLPENPHSMSSLYAAVTHGCAAGLYQEVFDDVLLRRIWRDRRTSFSTRRLGMVGSDLVALSNFFEHRKWTRLRSSSGLTTNARVLIQTNAAVRLRQLGRLVDARLCFGAVLDEIDIDAANDEQLSDASYAAAQYCELLVLAGQLVDEATDGASALKSGLAAVQLADRGSDPYFSMHARSCVAEVYMMLGSYDRAAVYLDEAIKIDADKRPRPPFLYSQSLYRYGYLLIESGRARDVLSSEQSTEGWGKNGSDSSLLSEAIRVLVAGAARRAVIESGRGTPELVEACRSLLDEAIVAFQTAGYADYLVRGLIERAYFYTVRRSTDDYDKALADLEKASFEASRGQMRLLYTDSLLQRVNAHLSFWSVMTRPERRDLSPSILSTFAEAAELVSAAKYGRRNDLIARLRSSVVELNVADSMKR